MSNKKSHRNWQINAILILFIIAGGIIVFRLFNLQVINYKTYLSYAQSQQKGEEKINPQRGKIYARDKDGNNYLLATNREYYSLFTVPEKVQKLENSQEKIENIAATLAEIIELKKETIKQRLEKKDDPFEPLAEKLTDQQYNQIKQLNLPGIYFSKNWKRWYPQESLAAHVLGFLGRSRDSGEIGQYGIEGYYQNILKGEQGWAMAEKDASGRWIGLTDTLLRPAIDGSNLYLTLDQNIQFMIEKKLQEVIKKWNAEGGSIIVMNPKTGMILGACSLPGFNPNRYFEIKNANIFLNPIIQKVYEPGSIFKPLTMAAGIDSGSVTPQTTYVDTGSVKIDGYTITNAAGKVFGKSSMTKVLEKSINTGIVFTQQQMDKQEFREYTESFSFGKPLGVDLVGELPGNIKNLKYKRDIDYATIAFGQGIAVTPLQIISAIAAIANDGKLMRPYLVDKIVRPDGTVKKTEPEVISRPISSQTASKLTAMMVSTVQNGYDKIKIPGYYIAGKTGTAQLPDPQKGGYLDEYIHSFVGFAPAYDPQFIVLIKLDRPQGIRFASSSLTPVFTDITKFLLNYLEILPDFTDQ